MKKKILLLVFGSVILSGCGKLNMTHGQNWPESIIIKDQYIIPLKDHISNQEIYACINSALPKLFWGAVDQNIVARTNINVPYEKRRYSDNSHKKFIYDRKEIIIMNQKLSQLSRDREFLSTTKNKELTQQYGIKVNSYLSNVFYKKNLINLEIGVFEFGENFEKDENIKMLNQSSNIVFNMKIIRTLTGLAVNKQFKTSRHYSVVNIPIEQLVFDQVLESCINSFKL